MSSPAYALDAGPSRRGFGFSMPPSLPRHACAMWATGLMAVLYSASSGCSQPIPAGRLRPPEAVPSASPAEDTTPVQPDAAAMPVSAAKICTPQCAGRECGDDGCGGRCGRCPSGRACEEDEGRCISCNGGDCKCVSHCDRRVCGSDGCSGSCGTCPQGTTCSDQGQCLPAQCGNGVVEAEEECDGEELCRNCKHLHPDQLTCVIAVRPMSDAPPECHVCACTECPTHVLNCFLSEDAERNMACQALTNCAAREKCYDLDCFCGTQRCQPPNGPCYPEAERVLGRQSIFDLNACYQDPDCAVYRSRMVGECVRQRCAVECGLTPAPSDSSPPSDAGLPGS
jgi:hypothetical protein